MEKGFEVCEEENDASFLRKYLTEPLVKRLDLYTYEREENANGDEEWVVKSTDWQQVRDEMVDGMTNFGVPIVRVEDGDYKRHGELYLSMPTTARTLTPNTPSACCAPSSAVGPPRAIWKRESRTSAPSFLRRPRKHQETL
jgi:spore cortex formation protein SpoVR/YcgB (stage V sporulation)